MQFNVMQINQEDSTNSSILPIQMLYNGSIQYNVASTSVLSVDNSVQTGAHFKLIRGHDSCLRDPVEDILAEQLVLLQQLLLPRPFLNAGGRNRDLHYHHRASTGGVRGFQPLASARGHRDLSWLIATRGERDLW